MADPKPDRSMLARTVVSGVLVVLVLVAGGVVFAVLRSFLKPPTRDAAAPPRTAVKVIAAQRADHREVLVGYGRARALRRATVSAELSAVVQRIAPELQAGVEVREAYPLVWLDDRDARSALAGSKARVDRAAAEQDRMRSDVANLEKRREVARVEMDSARRELARLQKLAEAAHASPSEVDAQSMVASVSTAAFLNLEGQIDSLRAQIERAAADRAEAEADMERAQDDLGRAVVAAPFAGVVEERLVDAGARVAPGTALFRIVDPLALEVPVALPASRFGQVDVGAAASVRLAEGAGVVWNGTVARVSPVVNTEERTFLVYLELRFEGAERPVPPGAFVVAEIEGATERGTFVVPRAAFVDETLFVAEPQGDGLAVVHARRPVVRRLLTDVALVDSGIEPGDLIVVSNIEQIADSSRVRVVAAEEPR